MVVAGRERGDGATQGRTRRAMRPAGRERENDNGHCDAAINVRRARARGWTCEKLAIAVATM